MQMHTHIHKIDQHVIMREKQHNKNADIKLTVKKADQCLTYSGHGWLYSYLYMEALVV